LGNVRAVERLLDYDRFVRNFVMDTPGGWSRTDFHHELAAEIRSDLRFDDAPPERAIRRAWRKDHMMDSHLPASRAWAAAIRREVARYIATLPHNSGHPFIASRPDDYVVGAWGVVSNGESHHVSHIHGRAWMSGVYYVVRPPVSHEAGSQRGWLEIGPPELYGVSTGHGWPTRKIEPEPGTLVLMPAYFFHSTRAFAADEERICIAFDVMLAELAT